ncbi:AarF/ABC1/UbiB kinase family protein [Candidatus Woesearchaeota archaeon]|nr:AarF/ABC1/UbiB kinase family protein [Candidatus Woesearchaeota archaeon]
MVGFNNIKNIKRIEQILSVVAKQGLGVFIENLQLMHLLPLRDRLNTIKKPSKMPIRIRMILDELGGAFIKLGQLLSLRPDLIPEEYCNELKKLQDDTKPFSFREVKQIIEHELKKPLNEVFSDFSEKPVASASIGQVHVGKLMDGKRVAVKVRRPHICELMDEDIDILYFLARHIEKKMKSEIIRPLDIVNEFERYTKKELDYMHEAKNIERFHSAFKSSHVVRIPSVYWDYTTEKVLVMEYIDGQRLSDIKSMKKVNRPQLAKNIANIVLEQIFIHGIFHADPHPGNIFILKNNRIALLDFGIIGMIDSNLRLKLSTIFIGFIQGDVDEIAEGFIELGMTEEGFDIDVLKEDIADTLGEYYNASLEKMNVPLIINKLIKMAIKDRIKVPSNVVLLGKALITLEGVCCEIDPKFNIIEVARPFADSMVSQRKSPEAAFRGMMMQGVKIGHFFSRLPDLSTSYLVKLTKVNSDLDKIDDDLRSISTQMKFSVKYIMLGVIVAVLILASAISLGYSDEVVFGFPKYSFIMFCMACFVFLVMLTVHPHND